MPKPSAVANGRLVAKLMDAARHSVVEWDHFYDDAAFGGATRIFTRLLRQALPPRLERGDGNNGVIFPFHRIREPWVHVRWFLEESQHVRFQSAFPQSRDEH